MAAERTFLAWVRTGIALMGFGFIVARFGLFLREVSIPGRAVPDGGSGVSIHLGLALIVVGVIANVVAAVRHRSYVQALDRGEFRNAFRSGFAFSIAMLLAVLGAVMALYLANL